MALVTAHSWPGNARELKSALEYAFMVLDHGPVRPEHLPPPRCPAGPESARSRFRRRARPSAGLGQRHPPRRLALRAARPPRRARPTFRPEGAERPCPPIRPRHRRSASCWRPWPGRAATRPGPPPCSACPGSRWPTACASTECAGWWPGERLWPTAFRGPRPGQEGRFGS